MRLLFVFILLVIISPLFAQKDFREGYIVKGGDTIKGFVRYNNVKASEEAVFKPARRQKAITYGIEEVSAYGLYDDKKYETIDMGTPDRPKKVFGLVLQKGEIDLYYSKEKYLLLKGDEKTVLQRKADSIVIGKSTTVQYMPKGEVYARDFRYRRQLKAITADCGLSTERMPYSRKQISRLVNDYNRCKNNFVIVKNTRPWIRVGVSVGFSAFSSSTMKMDTLPGRTFKGDVAPVSEFNADLRFPRLMDRIWLTVGFQPVKSTYTGSNSRTSTVQTISDQLTLDVSYFKLPFSLKYSFGNPGYSFFVRGGAWQGKLQNTNFTTFRTTVVTHNNHTTTENQKVPNGYRNPSGAFLGFGYDQRLVGRLRLFAEVRYERNNGILGASRTAYAHYNFFSAFVGIGI